MKITASCVFTAFAMSVVAFTGNSVAQIPGNLPFVSPIFGEHMVLQRNKENPIWGWTKPGEKVQVTLDGKTVSAVAGEDGRWIVKVQPPKPGGPYALSIQGSQNIEFKDIMVGDVWLCGGQSNMEFGMKQDRDADTEIPAAQNPNIRLFMVPAKWKYAPADVPEGAWKLCTPETISEGGWFGFTAVGYYFGRKLQRETGVPVGLIQSCLGGTTAETWTGEPGLKGFPEYAKWIDKEKETIARGGTEYGIRVLHWFEDHDPHFKDWFQSDVDDSSWKVVSLPGAFEQLGAPAEKPAIVYFRKTIELPDPLPEGDAFIKLGQIERMDFVAVNGVQVGSSAWVQNPRNYPIPGWLVKLKPGKNEIVVRVLKTDPNGGFQSPPDDLKLVVGKSEFPLADGWNARISSVLETADLPESYDPWPTNMPSGLYNAMIAPLAPLAISGAIWYQGESNASRATQYRKLLPALIADWRRTFNQGDFPFYIVSLAGFTAHKDDPNIPDEWAELRAAQDQTAHTVPNSGLAITIDVGDSADIHPKDKKTVGERLAAIALANYYGKPVAFSGPRFASMRKVPGGLEVSFIHADGGLMVKGDKLEEFSVAGVDGVWHWADARIEGDKVLLTSTDVADPVAAKYAWQAFPKATFFNGAGFPAIPFNTQKQDQ